MREIGFFKLATQVVLIVLVAVAMTAASDRLLEVTAKVQSDQTPSGQVIQKGFTSSVNLPSGDDRNPSKPWQLPARALDANATETVHILVLRYNFQYEAVDDPNTTGRGWMNLGDHPLPDSSNNATPADSIAYLDSVGHFIDPPPHDSVYFDAHLQALNRYWSAVSEGRLNLTWDIYPPARDSVYQLPREMAYYGRCDSVIIGLEYYFEDCIRLVDSAHLIDPGHPDIDFSQYDAFILFHAGSDRQNDIGFPETCSDLFTGFIRFGNPIAVDGGALRVGTALMVPETSSQDNRATALNAVLAHEFGHHLGLVDLYSTTSFLSQIGDFALMDNNGFGTGINFGFPVGRSFGVIPLYPMAWSRAFLGYVDVYDFRQGTDIGIVAAEMESNDSIKIARVPISEKQYYLIENRQVETNGIVTNAGADRTTNVILGPAFRRPGEDSLSYSREYDFLMPGSGLAIWLIDEEVAEWDFDDDGLNNFLDNQLQVNKDRRFIQLMEADGLVHFGGNYRSGYGRPEDLFRDDRATSFTPLTNPPTVDNMGNDTRVFITGITRDTVTPPGGTTPIYLDSLIKFDLDTDKRAGMFPIRAGLPALGLSPIADDLNGDGIVDILIPAGRNLIGVTTQGDSYLATVTGCDTCGLLYDSLYSNVGVNNRSEPLPIFAELPILITAGPVTGELSGLPLGRQVAVGYAADSNFTIGGVMVLVSDSATVDLGGRAVEARSIATEGIPIALSFGNSLWVLTSTGYVYHVSGIFDTPTEYRIYDSLFYGTVRIGDYLAVLSGDSLTMTTHLNLINSLISDSVYTFEVDGLYEFGPVVTDLDRDNVPELIAFTADGDAIILSIDLTASPSEFVTVDLEVSTNRTITTNPIVGDMDGDNQPDIVIGGENSILSFDRYLTLIDEYPVQVSDLFPGDFPVAAPILADIDSDGRTDVLFPSLAGSLHAKGPDERIGFPVSNLTYNGTINTTTVGSPLLFSDSTGGMFGFLSADGWFYAYETNLDTSTTYWPMAGGEPTGSFSFDVSSLGTPVTPSSQFDSDAFYAWPNPVMDGVANIRYFLGEQASSVRLKMYDLSGVEIARLDGPTNGGVHNEVVWDCSGVTPGVYRCMIEVTFADGSARDFADIAVIR